MSVAVGGLVAIHVGPGLGRLVLPGVLDLLPGGGRVGSLAVLQDIVAAELGLAVNPWGNNEKNEIENSP